MQRFFLHKKVAPEKDPPSQTLASESLTSKPQAKSMTTTKIKPTTTCSKKRSRDLRHGTPSIAESTGAALPITELNRDTPLSANHSSTPMTQLSVQHRKSRQEKINMRALPTRRKPVKDRKVQYSKMTGHFSQNSTTSLLRPVFRDINQTVPPPPHLVANHQPTHPESISSKRSSLPVKQRRRAPRPWTKYLASQHKPLMSYGFSIHRIPRRQANGEAVKQDFSGSLVSTAP
jgi:hypothetical protein